MFPIDSIESLAFIVLLSITACLCLFSYVEHKMEKKH
jgi:hypothetical protein